MLSSREMRDERKRILLVDDERSVRDSVYTLLESDGYIVLAASNAPDGLSIFHRSLLRVDLLVTDCNMPGMTGLELARACNQCDGNVGVLYISGSTPNEELQSDLETPRRAFLLKPFRGDDLLRKAKELLAPGFDRDVVQAHPIHQSPAQNRH
jgi:CheY-like chemotaxis protein